MKKPSFVKKEDRVLLAQLHQQAEKQVAGEEEEERHRKARELLAETLKRDRASASNAAQAALTSAQTDPFSPFSVDDTDGLDPEMERLEWELRCLQRAKRDKERAEALQKEREEVERIRKLSEEERQDFYRAKLAEDAEKEAEKGEYGFLQKYYHPGAFFQDAVEKEPVLQRDYSVATGIDRIAPHKDTLPEPLQVRDFGKRSRSKWKHLTAEDTTAFDYGWGSKKIASNYTPSSRMGGMKKQQ